MKQFLFLYPIQEYFDVELDNGSLAYSFRQVCPDEEETFARKLEKAQTGDEKETIRQEARAIIRAKFKLVYARVLNTAIKQRYRQQGFDINFAVFDRSPVSDIVELQEGDKVFQVGVDFKTHCSKKVYPNPDYVLEQVRVNGDHLRVAGFHMWDCVEKVAKRAYEKGVDVLVDEDLTEFLTGRISLDPEFRTDRFPTYNPRKLEETIYKFFVEARKDKPWLWQNY